MQLCAIKLQMRRNACFQKDQKKIKMEKQDQKYFPRDGAFCLHEIGRLQHKKNPEAQRYKASGA